MEKNGNLLLKIFIAIAGTLITVGVLCATIRNNEKRITQVELKAVENEKDIRELKTDVKCIRKGVDDIKDELKK